MPENLYSRCFDFEAIRNFRDLGGYRTQGDKVIAWRRLFRSGELRHMTRHDIAILKGEIKLNAVIDLRSSSSTRSLGVGLLDELEVKYYCVPLYISLPINSWKYEREKALFLGFTSLGEVYSYHIRQPEVGQNIIKVLETIADQDNLPLVFHCNAGQSRSGIIAAVVLSALGVADDDVIQDYTLSAPHMKEFVQRWNNDPQTADIYKTIPPYENEATAESMTFFLETPKRQYGSARRYLEMHGAEASLFSRLEKALLT
jgi:protein-tyrosine phosphatase